MSQSKDFYTLEEIFHYKDKSDEVKKLDINEVRRLTTIKFDNTTLKSDIAILKENIKRYEKFVEDLCSSPQANTSSDHRQGDWPPRIDPLNHVLRIPPPVNLNNTSSARSTTWKDYGSCLEYFHSLTRQLRHIQSAFTGGGGPRGASNSGDDPRLTRRNAIMTSHPAALNSENARLHPGRNNRQDWLLRERLFSQAPITSLTFKEYEELMNQKNKLITEKEDLQDKLKKVKLRFEKERIKLSQQQQQQESPLIQMEVLDFHGMSSEDDDEEEEEDWAQLNEEEKDNWEDASSSVEENYI